MMKKVAVIAVTMVVLLSANRARADVCQIINGSFEDDGYIPDITVQEPNGWDVNMPASKFSGFVDNDWSTEANYSLTLHTDPWKVFENGDMTKVSQEVDLTDANEIIFDLKLNIWDPNIFSAVVLIECNEVCDIVWDSNWVAPDSNNEYRNETYTVEDKYRIGGPCKLSLGIKVNVSEMLYIFYITKWDYIECTGFCGGFGLLAGDFDHDCYVDRNDLEMFTDVWLDEVDPNDKYNLFQDELDPNGIINFLDFAVYADSWDGNMPDLKMFTDVWLEEVDANNIYNLFHDNDVGPRGVVNFFDFAIFADDWLKTSYEQGE